MIVTRDPVGVTGVGVICAAGRDVDELWANVRAGTTAVGPARSSELAGFDGAFAGEIPDEWLEAGFPAAERACLDRASLLSVVAIRQALGDAGLDAAALRDGRVGLVMGKCQADPGRGEGRLAHIHDTGDEVARYFCSAGPRVVVSTACAAGGNAVGLARDMLWRDEADIVVAGGVDVLLATTFVGFGALQALAPAPCAPYSRSDGLSLGEGAAFLVVERVRDALAAGRPVLAEVRGYGLSADAHHPTGPDPTGRGAVLAVERALAEAGATVDDVSYVNGHGTGTPSNDRMERKVMRTLFGARSGRVPISGTKSFVGHTLGASGAIEAVVCVLAIRDGVVPPTGNFDASRGSGPDDLDFVPHRARPGEVDLVVSNNYAFGGNNASLVLSRVRRAVRDAARPAPQMARVAVTGFGPVGPLGVGVGPWREALAAGRSGLEPVALPGAEAGDRAAVMTPLCTKPFADPRQWRQMSELGRQCLAATKLACDDAELALDRRRRDELGLVFATGFGPMQDALSFSAGQDAAPKVSAFANITMNAPPGAVCRALGVRGPTTTITVGATSFFHGLSCAADLIAQGKAPAVVVLAADELTADIFRLRRALEGRTGWLSPSGDARPYSARRDGACLGHAVVACVVEDRETAVLRGAPIYAELTACATFGTGDGAVTPASADAYAATIREALDRGGVSAREVGYCAGMASGHAADVVEARAFAECLDAATLLSAPRELTGDCEAASGAVNALCAALAVSCGGPPPLQVCVPVAELTLTPVRAGQPAAPVDHALATGMTLGGNYAAALFSAVDGGRR